MFSVIVTLFASAKLRVMEACGATSKHILLCSLRELPCGHLLAIVKAFNFVRCTEEEEFHIDKQLVRVNAT